MTRLSIVIPAYGDQVSLESTLLSVLENRPAACEVLVVCSASYRDEYGLDDEVCFVRAATNFRHAPPWHELANLGLAESNGEIIHLLQPGVQVEEGWADSALELLDFEMDISAVSPLVFVPDHSAPIMGVLVGPGGKRLEVRHRSLTDQAADGFAPSRSAGFFRRSSLALVGGWNNQIAAEYADVELGCALGLLGHRCKVARLCQVKSAANVVLTKANGFASGLAHELIIRRYDGIGEKRLANSALVASLARLPNPSAFGYLLGRIAGRLQSARRPKAVNLSSERTGPDGRSQAA